MHQSLKETRVITPLPQKPEMLGRLTRRKLGSL